MDIRPMPAAQLSPPNDVEQRLGAILSSARRFVDVTVPRTDPPVRGKMRRLTRAEEEEVSLSLGRWMRSVAEDGAPPPERMETSSQEATRIIAIAVRDPCDVDRPLGTIDEWRQGDEGQIGAVYQAYCDLVEEMSLFEAVVTAVERSAIADAVKKKEHALLTSFGARRLAAYLLTTDEPPAS